MPNDITIQKVETTGSEKWQINYIADKSSNPISKTFATAGKLLDRNMELNIFIPTVSGSIGGTASAGSATAVLTNLNSINTITNTTGKTAGTDYWGIQATATTTAGSYTPSYSVTTAGWISSTAAGSAQTVSVTADTTG
jgi:hypothetical protein